MNVRGKRFHSHSSPTLIIVPPPHTFNTTTFLQYCYNFRVQVCVCVRASIDIHALYSDPIPARHVGCDFVLGSVAVCDHSSCGVQWRGSAIVQQVSISRHSVVVTVKILALRIRSSLIYQPRCTDWFASPQPRLEYAVWTLVVVWSLLHSYQINLPPTGSTIRPRRR